MSSRERLTLASAFAVAMGAVALVPLYSDFRWLFLVLGAIVSVAGAGLLARRANLPGLLQLVATTAGLTAFTCLAFARDTLALGLLPTGRTLSALHGLLEAGLTDIDRLAPPVPSNTGLTLIAVLGIGAVAVAVDLVAVIFGRAAAAGLPLLVLFAVPSAVLPGGLGWIPFVLGASGWLSLLLVEGGDRVGRWGTPLQASRPDRSERYDDTSLGRVGRRIGAAALGVAVIVPAMIPGLDARLIGGGGGDGLGGSGSRTTTTYNPITKLRDDLQQPEKREVLSYTTTAKTPDYLRMTTLDRFSDAGWSSSKLTGDPKRDGVKGTLPTPEGQTSARTEDVSTTIKIKSLDAQWLPAPAVPSKVSVDGPWLYDSRSETVFGIRTGTKKLKKRYTVTSTHVLADRQLLAAIDSGSPDDVRQYALDPRNEVTQVVRQLTERVIGNAQSPYAKVAAIQAFFRDPTQKFEYSTSTQVKGINSKSALEDFLVGRKGFCEQYASAMAAMIRIAGVPARVAVGFTPGTRQKDGSYVVTTHDAHAWPEAWFAGTGWVRFEPTPQQAGHIDVPGYAAATAANGAPTPGGPTDPLPNKGGAAAANDPKLAKLDRLDPAVAPAPGAAKAHRSVRSATRSLLLPGLVLLVLLALLPWLLHGVRGRRRWRRADAQSVSARAWQQVCDDAVDVGHLWRAADSPRAAAAHLAQRHAFDAPAREALARVAAAAERARYARDAGAVDGLRDDTAVVRAALRSSVGRSARWRATLLPTSTLQWASSTTGTMVADGLDRFDETWARLTRRLRPRAA